MTLSSWQVEYVQMSKVLKCWGKLMMSLMEGTSIAEFDHWCWPFGHWPVYSLYYTPSRSCKHKEIRTHKTLSLNLIEESTKNSLWMITFTITINPCHQWWGLVTYRVTYHCSVTPTLCTEPWLLYGIEPRHCVGISTFNCRQAAAVCVCVYIYIYITIIIVYDPNKRGN